MLTRLALRNYRGFADHEIEFGPLTVLVGPNNAGKSTIVEALRLVALVVERHLTLGFRPPPRAPGVPVAHRGLRPSLHLLDLDLSSLPHRLEGDVSVASAQFAGGASIDIYVSERSGLFAALRDPQGRAVTDRTGARELGLRPLMVVPQLGPLALDERPLEASTVRDGRLSRLTSLHFRNELCQFPDRFEEFAGLAASIWPGTKVQRLLPPDPLAQSGPRLLVRDGDYAAEVGQMGSGMQMWLQTAWFLAQATPASAVVLDEPDTYLHPDLQLRLMRMLQQRYAQTVVSTHSVEIMTTVAPDQVVLVDRQAERSRFLRSVGGLQDVVDAIGAPHNLQLVRLASSRRFLLVEGDDQALLAEFQKIVLPEAPTEFRSIPCVAMGGWSAWRYYFRECVPRGRTASGHKIRTYCVLDRDYHTRAEEDACRAEAENAGVALVIWERKELENYLLCPAAISRAVAEHARDPGVVPSADRVQEELGRAADGLRESVLDKLADRNGHANRGWEPSRCRQAAEQEVAEAWTSFEGKMSIIPGKEALAFVKRWCQQEFKVSINEHQVIRSMQKSDVLEEVAQVVRAISECTEF